MLLGLHTYSFYLHGIGQAWTDFKLPWPRQMSTFELFDEMEIPLDDMRKALQMEKETIERSIRYCRDILGIKKEYQERN
jgi:hypothetical protein